jgi:HD-like signal output (HDOD) protein
MVQSLAREFAPEYTDGIFLCGLMHDVGKMLLIESGEIVYSTRDMKETLASDLIHIDERMLLGYDHAVLAGHVLTAWKIPEPIPKVVAWHHQPIRAYEHKNLGVMVSMLRIADQLDAVFRDSPDNLTEFVDKLARKPDMAFVSLSADDLKGVLDKLYSARLDSLRMFGG